MNKNIIVYTIQDLNTYETIDFYFPREFISKEASFSEGPLDLRFLKLSVRLRNKAYQLCKCSICYNETSYNRLLDIIEADLMHIAKIYSQCSYTLRKKNTPIINDYEIKKFHDNKKNIKDAIKFLATLSSIESFSTFNKRVNSIIIMEINKTLENKVETIAKKVISDNLPDLSGKEFDQTINNVVKNSLVILKRSMKEYSDLAIENLITQQLEQNQVGNIADDAFDTVVSNNIKVNTDVAKHCNSNTRSGYFFSPDAIMDIARAHGISISKSAAKVVNAKVNSYNNKLKTLSEYENLVIDCINKHSQKIYESKLFDCLKNNLNKAGFSWTSIGKDLIDDYYKYIINNIMRAPQSFFDTTASDFFKATTNGKDDDVVEVDSEESLSFEGVVDKIPSIKNYDYVTSAQIDPLSYLTTLKKKDGYTYNLDAWGRDDIDLDEFDITIVKDIEEIFIKNDIKSKLGSKYNKALLTALNLVNTKEKYKRDELCEGLSQYLKDNGVNATKAMTVALTINNL